MLEASSSTSPRAEEEEEECISCILTPSNEAVLGLLLRCSMAIVDGVIGACEG